MKICPKCSKGYDDSWGVCLKCGVKLVGSGGGGVSGEEFLDFINKSNIEFQKINYRLEKIEKALHVESSAAEKVGTIEVEKIKIAPKETPAPMAEIKKEKEKTDIESTIGLVWFNRIGILAIFLGAAFFIKYAFDNHWIGVIGRVIIGLAAGFGMIIGSEFARHKKYDVMSQGLHGGGIGILYLSVFSAFGFYHLIGSVPAFFFMSLVTLYCGFWSTRTDWVSSAVIGVIGGFATPIVIGLNGLQPALLFSYCILLDLGAIYISMDKKWNGLNIGSFFMTHILFYGWLGSRYRPDDWVTAFLFAALFFALFCVLSIIRNLLYRENSDNVDITLVLANGLIFFFELFFILKPHALGMPGLLPITLSCIYIGFSYSALNRRREDNGLVLSYVGLAVIFVTVAIPIQLKYNWVAISWAIEALVLVWMGFNLSYPSIRKIGLGIGALSLFKILLFDYSYDTYRFAGNTFLLNERMLIFLHDLSQLDRAYRIISFIALGALLLIASFYYQKYKDEIRQFTMKGE